MISKNFDELYGKYKDATYVGDRRIRVKLKEILACYDECLPDEQEFTNEIIDKFCELIDLIEARNEEERQALIFKYDNCQSSSVSAFQISSQIEGESTYQIADELLVDFYNSFINSKTESTMKDYVARIKTFAYSGRYLGEMLDAGVLGVRTIDIDPLLFTYENIEMILARFNTKDENGESVKQRLNLRSALRMLNEFKKNKT